ncbi:hypothetical protein GCM10009789_75900 [Kribbella sancticallisti]|uniref:Uncharacterized protein n=1 Tax=Kribbella sancticallisti TaxID=460087 RepID=A0ABP4QFZ6_9ACTN
MLSPARFRQGEVHEQAHRLGRGHPRRDARPRPGRRTPTGQRLHCHRHCARHSTGGTLSPERTQALADKLAALTPAGQPTTTELLKQKLGVDDNPLSELVDQVINPADYTCTASTPVRDWLVASRADWTPQDVALVNAIRSWDPIFYDAVLWPQDAGSQFGANGQFTTATTHTFRDLRNFWDIHGADIKLVPMHGSMLLDRPRLVRLFAEGYGLPVALANEFADEIATAMNQEKFDFGNHPFFTFNAFAFAGQNIPGFTVIPAEILMGDGILAAYQALGYDDVTAQAILAHEYGHHVQFQRGLFQTTLTGPEAARRIELMADSFASYFLTHARGDALQWKRIQEFDQVFFQLGDCSFTAGSHHGTPNQRLRASEWGYGVARTAANQGHILPSLAFAGLFDRQLPTLVAPDAN